MKLSALIQGKRSASSLSTATANLAKVAKDNANLGDSLPRLARLATLALATAGESEILDISHFSDIEPLKAAPPAQSTRCFSCHGSDFWERALTGGLICRKCHPPAIPELELVTVNLPITTIEEELMQMIRDTYAELDSLRDWTGWRQSLTDDERQRLIIIEERVDATYAALDRNGLILALKDIKTAHTMTEYYRSA